MGLSIHVQEMITLDMSREEQVVWSEETESVVEPSICKTLVKKVLR